MKFKVRTTIFALALVLVAGFVTHSLTTGAASVSADSERHGSLHITKDCAAYNGLAGGHCTIASSNLAEITAGTKVIYDQAPGIPAGMLDSNVLLSVGTGDWATGRCTLDFSTGLGLCTFSDGTGPLARFTARVNVSYLGGTLWAWDGTYSFRGERD